MDTRKQVRVFVLLLVSCCPLTKQSYWYCIVGALLETGKPDEQNALKTQEVPNSSRSLFGRAFSHPFAGQSQAVSITTSFTYLESEQTPFLANP